MIVLFKSKNSLVCEDRGFVSFLESLIYVKRI
nr:MAG TPA: Insulin Chain A, Insulin Chain, HORMONE.18A [Bacteriophage sp.]